MLSPTWIKICGLSTPEAVSAAVLGGADAVGFVLAPGSPRTIGAAEAGRLAQLVPDEVETVAVFRGQPVDEVVQLAAKAGVSTVQLHGDEPCDDFDVVREAGFRAIRAVSAERYAVETPAERAAYGEVRILLDAPVPGEGVPFDPAALVEPPTGEWILAGGLRADNVVALAEALRPSGVDVSSGVEVSRGVKDPALIRGFIAAVRR